MKMRNSNIEMQRVVDALARNRVLWVRTFAPLRRALSGDWTVKANGAGLQLHLDAEGQFKLDNSSAGLTFSGSFALGKVDNSMYLILDSQRVCYVLRIDEMDANRMKLVWTDETAETLWLEKSGLTEIAEQRLRMM